ncbi:MAG: hypothetical protein P8L39_05030, partial [Halioglobus sp.]|nr:hypothetical protein [Halioglobus sp.]
MLTESVAFYVDRVSRSPSLYLGLGVGCILLAYCYILNATPSFDQRTIGIAIQHGLDPSVRNVVHVLGVLAGVCLFLSVFLGLRSLHAEQLSSFESGTSGSAFVFLLLANLLLYFWYDNVLFLTAAGALFYLMALGLVVRFFGNEPRDTGLIWVLAALTFQGIVTAGAIFRFHL